jgi:hypothetical protein
MIVLQHPDADPNSAMGRAFIPDGETRKVDELLAEGYRIWKPATVPVAPVAVAEGTAPASGTGVTPVTVDFTLLSGVGPELAALFVQHGWMTLDDLRNVSDVTLLDLPGIGPAKLAKIRGQL